MEVLLLSTSMELEGGFYPISLLSAFILVVQWIGLGVLRQAVELSSRKGWVEQAPCIVCLFCKLPGFTVLCYLSLSKQITEMEVVMIRFTIITWIISICNRLFKFVFYSKKFTGISLSE